MTFTPRRVSVFENTFRPGLDSATFTVHVAPAGTLSFLFPSVTFFFAARAARDASKRVFTLLLKSNVILHDSTAPSGQPTLARTWNPLRRTRTSFSLLKLAPCSSLRRIGLGLRRRRLGLGRLVLGRLGHGRLGHRRRVLWRRRRHRRRRRHGRRRRYRRRRWHRRGRRRRAVAGLRNLRAITRLELHEHQPEDDCPEDANQNACSSQHVARSSHTEYAGETVSVCQAAARNCSANAGYVSATA